MNPDSVDNAVDKGHFGWEPCCVKIVTKTGEEVLRCAADVNDVFHLRVTLERDLAWDRGKKAWRWHKTWRVPDCVVTADTLALGGHGGVEAHISVVCAGGRPNELVDAGVTSSERASAAGTLQLVDGECRFSRLRLVGTTSTFGGRMFHFVVSLVRRDGAATTALASLISTSFAVYSRKNADKKRKAIDKGAIESGRWSEGYSFVPFEPKELQRTFVKKVTDGAGNLLEERIDNSWVGLLRYFQAPNIRFKVRHPLFLAIRFSNVLVILRDALRFPDESENALRSFICSCGFPLNCSRDPAVDIGHGEFLPPWLIAFRNSAFSECPAEVRQKLQNFMEVVKGPALGFVPDDSLVPQRYQPTFNVQSLGYLYSKLYALEFASKAKQGDASAEVKRARVDGGSGRAEDNSGKLEPEMNSSTMFSPSGGASSSSQTNGTGSHGEAHAEMRAAFRSYFISLHAELRMLLNKVVELATTAVSNGHSDDVVGLRRAYQDFTEALSVHAYVEEHVLFSKLSERVPRVTESYNVDHVKEGARMAEIENIMRDMDGKKFAEVFLKIAEFAALHTTHMEKEEEHLLPYFLEHFDDVEISELIQRSKAVIDEMQDGQQRGRVHKINLQNSRHKAAIDRARVAVGLSRLDEMSDPPDNADDHPSFYAEDDDALNLIEQMF